MLNKHSFDVEVIINDVNLTAHFDDAEAAANALVSLHGKIENEGGESTFTEEESIFTTANKNVIIVKTTFEKLNKELRKELEKWEKKIHFIRHDEDDEDEIEPPDFYEL